ncbi:hypothetical protein TgHK011_009712 [Trichoderma gracile]|nr:hypothetical protein TgHK011_009712 [Trichoderma gracile]
MSHLPKFHTRAWSKASLASVGQLPVIDENSNTIIIIPPSSTTTTPSPPPALLRSSAGNFKRNMGPLAERQPNNPYIVGFMDLPPGVLTINECKDEEGDDDEDEETVTGQMTPVPRGCPEKFGRWRTGGSLQRRCHVVLVVAVVLVVLVGLAVGLALGLTK